MTIKTLLKPVLFVFFLILFLSLFLKCFDRFGRYMLERKTKDTVTAIRSEYTGIVIDKYLDANAIICFKLKTPDSGNIYVSVTNTLAFNTQVGDTLVKQKNDNYVLVKRQTGDSLWVLYTPIYSDVREHELFPKEWKDKWLDAIPNRR